MSVRLSHRVVVIVAALGFVTGPVSAAAVSQAASIPDHAGETAAQTAARVLPGGAVLAHPPVSVDFGAYQRGVAVIYHPSTDDRSCAVVYVAPPASGSRRVTAVHRPGDTENLFDTVIRAVLAVPAPSGGSDLVVLTHVSRPAISGGLDVDTGDIYRMNADASVSVVEGANALLDGVRNAADARKRLAAATSKPSSRRSPIGSAANPMLASAADATGIAADAAVDAERVGGVRADFIDLPDDITGIPRSGRESLSANGSQRLVELDRANGFLQIAGDGGLPGYVVARFRSGLGPVVGLTVYYTGQQRTRFFARDARQKTGWREVTNDVVPGYDPAKQYTLPHHGTILVEENADGSGRTTLAWKEDHFDRLVQRNSE